MGFPGDPGPRGDGNWMKGLESVQHVGCRGSGDERHREGGGGASPELAGQQLNIPSFVQLC